MENKQSDLKGLSVFGFVLVLTMSLLHFCDPDQDKQEGASLEEMIIELENGTAEQ